MTGLLLPLYIDPGTGSMLFSIFIGLATTLVFAFRAALIKLRTAFAGRKEQKKRDSHLGVAIYSDSKRYWNIFRPIAREFESRGVPLVYYTQSPDDPALNESFKYVSARFIGEGNKGIAKMNFLDADICLSTTPGLDVLQWKRSKECPFYVHIFHEVGEPLTYRMFGIDYYDALLCSGDFQHEWLRKIEKLRGLPQRELTTVGCPYFDEMDRRLKSEKEEPQTKNIRVLLAPSWGKSAILSRYGSGLLLALQKTDFDITIRPHPQSAVSEKDLLRTLQNKFPETEAFHWNFENDNFSSLKRADILITDFSGIIFDFSLVFDKPVIYADTHFDSGVYDAAWIEGEKLWRFSTLEKIGIPLKEEQFAGLKGVIENALQDTSLKKNREAARNEAWMKKGNGASLVADYLIKKQKEIRQKASR